MQEGGHYIQLARWIYAFMGMPVKYEGGSRYVRVSGLSGEMAARFLYWLRCQHQDLVEDQDKIQWVEENLWQDWCLYSLGLNIDETQKEDA